jgi:hypothetical protein
MFLERLRVFAIVSAALAMTVSASAQTAPPPPHIPLQKTIGAAKPEVVPSKAKSFPGSMFARFRICIVSHAKRTLT